ncbi:hypothetical protein Bca4012_059496 [Brassica carinata]
MQLGLTWASHGSSLRQPGKPFSPTTTFSPPISPTSMAHLAKEGCVSGIRQRRGTAVSPLRYRQNAAVADRSNGPEDVVQCLWRQFFSTAAALSGVRSVKLPRKLK